MLGNYFVFFGTVVVPPASKKQVESVSVDDRDLIAQFLQGDSEAFGELVRRYQDRLFNTVLRMVGSAEDAQDVVQDAFLNAYQSLHNFKGDSLFFTWIYRIAINTAISLKRRKRTVMSIDVANEQGNTYEPLDSSESNRPAFALETAEESRIIHEALQRLSPEHRAVLIMKDMEGQKYETMAEILEVPIGTIRSRLHRARLELREILESNDSIDK